MHIHRVARLATPLILVATCAGAGVSGSAADAAGKPHLAPFKSTIYPYTISYPYGWLHRVLTLQSLKLDAFLRPVTTGGFRDNINIGRTPLPAGVTSSAALLRAEEAQVRQAYEITGKPVGHVRVAGQNLVLIGYNLRIGGRVVATTQAALDLGGKAWYFTLSAAPGDARRLRPLFVAVLGTFRPVSKVTPV